ncbi:MAG: aminotransferase class I/II-fold pyridoxal phosphate-dependent enzyme [Candidatus Omnitrophica bacterium]|nr:aminotransferase class I/II-fold pyridoxal phosphate-dependent enzyme [Candidatus Omnitrophota bacterium]
MLLKKIPKRNILMYPGELKDVFSLVRSGDILEGPFIEEFEEAFKAFTGAKEAVAVSSGRFAMDLILKELGLKKGDGVIISAYNFKGVPRILSQEGLELQFIDADKDTYQIDIDQIEPAINGKTKAIIVTHLFGQLCDMDRISQIASRHNLLVIEDAAHALGSYYKGAHAGTIGRAGFFSFSGSKTLNTSFGGMLVTSDKALAESIRDKLRDFPFPDKKDLLREIPKKWIYTLLTKRVFYSLTEYPLTLLMSLFGEDPLEVYKKIKGPEIGDRKMRFTNLQAMVGKRQLGYVKDIIEGRRRVAEKLMEKIRPFITLQKIPSDGKASYFMFCLKAKDKMTVFKKLLYKGIDSNLAYASDCSYMAGDKRFQNASELDGSVITFNLPYDLGEKEIFYIAGTLKGMKELLC